jgi:hypothetical protein
MFLKEPVYSEPGKTKVQLTLENSITSRVLHNQDSLEQRLSKEILSTLSGYEIAAVQMAYTKKRITVRELCDYLGRTPKTLRPVLRGKAYFVGMVRGHGILLSIMCLIDLVWERGMRFPSNSLVFSSSKGLNQT